MNSLAGIDYNGKIGLLWLDSEGNLSLQPISKAIIMECMCPGCKFLFPIVLGLPDLINPPKGYEPVLIEGTKRHNEVYMKNEK